MSALKKEEEFDFEPETLKDDEKIDIKTAKGT